MKEAASRSKRSPLLGWSRQWVVVVNRYEGHHSFEGKARRPFTRGYRRVHSPHGYLHHGELLAYGDGTDEFTVPPLLVLRFAGIILPDLCQLHCSCSSCGTIFPLVTSTYPHVASW